LARRGPESAPTAGGQNRARRGGLGKSRERLTHGTVKAPDPPGSDAQREREPVEWARDAGRVQVNGSGPIEIRNGFLNLDKGFPLLQNRK
jgi:hypothetical protein